MAAALERLPERYRDVLERHLLRHQTPQEIARAKDASPATVRVELHRGLARLRPLLPAGLAGGLVLSLSERGHAGLRGELLAHASRALPAAPLTAGATATTAQLGSLLMLQRLGLGLAAVTLLLLVARVSGFLGAEPRPAPPPSLEAQGLRVVEAPAAPAVDVAPARAAARVEAPPAASPRRPRRGRSTACAS
ncbi:MAG: sigma-70 family RNA polymerase sigma factor [Planctomycetes bacterium]|nr:sigma-70 family RNA polymerase sigma factor [Planctomycetota bacterium]